MCGIVGIFSHADVATELYDSLIHLQHRGQDSAGIMTSDTRFHQHRGKGLVRDIFTQSHIDTLTGQVGIGHVRYPTAGYQRNDEIQPFWLNTPYGIAIAHNGNIVNHASLANELKEQHRHLNTQSDTEVLLNLFADGFNALQDFKDNDTFFKQLCQTVSSLQAHIIGSYSVVGLIMNKGFFAFRDPFGIRPLVYGIRENKHGQKEYIFASEPTMFHTLGFQKRADVQPGEVIYIDKKGKLHQKTLQQASFSPCIFEYIYFARPDSTLDEISVYRARLRMGQNLARHWKTTYPDLLPDVVIAAPATSNTAALAFAHELGVRYSEGLYKNPFIGRTFIMSQSEERKKSVRYKLSPQELEIKDKIVLILDDSIVRGTTSKEIVTMIREYGAKKVYFATTCPPVHFPCFYGIDIPTREELIAYNKTLDEIKNHLNVDKLLYQSTNNLVEAVTRKGKHKIKQPCMACLTGCYLTEHITKEKITELENKRLQQRIQQKKE